MMRSPPKCQGRRLVVVVVVVILRQLKCTLPVQSRCSCLCCGVTEREREKKKIVLEDDGDDHSAASVQKVCVYVCAADKPRRIKLADRG